MNCFTWSIQDPGFGRKRSQAGCAQSSKYGALIPAAIATNIDNMIAGDWVKAKPSAVPKKGAVHGVASTVAKTPWKNEPASPWAPVQPSNPRVALCGSEIYKTPNKLSANTRTMTLKTSTKYALVSWSPAEVISRPAALSAINKAARPINKAKIPRENAIPLRKIF